MSRDMRVRHTVNHWIQLQPKVLEQLEVQEVRESKWERVLSPELADDCHTTTHFLSIGLKWPADTKALKSTEVRMCPLSTSESEH